MPTRAGWQTVREVGSPTVRVAVVIPAYQAERTIAQALASVFAQTRAADEIWVVDDGSSDGTVARVHEQLRPDGRLRLLRQARAGPASARNRAIAATRCDLVAPLDADDMWDPDYLAAMIDALECDPAAAFAYCSHRLIDQQGVPLREPPAVPLSGGCFGPMLLINPVGNGSSALFRRTSLLAAGGYAPPSDEWWGAEDYLLQLRLAARHPVAKVDRVLSSYRVHPSSLSSDARAARRARLQAIDAALREFGPCPLPVRSWADGDSARVQAVRDLQAGAVARALSGLAYALLRDPTGTVADVAARCGNLLARVVRRCGPSPRMDRLTAARLRRLQRAMPYGYQARPYAGDSAAGAPAGPGSLRTVRPPDGDNSAPCQFARQPG